MIPEDIKRLARKFELDNPTMPHMLSVEAVLEWLDKDYVIIPKATLDKHLIEMAKDYAMYLEPDNKVAREMIELDSLGFLNWVMGKYDIVEKTNKKGS